MDLNELRQNTAELVRRAQAGEEFTITVSGRQSARLVPLGPTRWRRWDEIADLFSGPTDADWQHDSEGFRDDLRDPSDKR